MKKKNKKKKKIKSNGTTAFEFNMKTNCNQILSVQNVYQCIESTLTVHTIDYKLMNEQYEKQIDEHLLFIVIVIAIATQ